MPFKTPADDFDFHFEVALDVLVDFVVDFGLFAPSDLVLEVHDLIMESYLLFRERVVLELLDVELALQVIVVSDGHRILELVKEKSKLQQCLCLPLLKRVDPLLHKDILLSQLTITRMELTAQQLPLLLERLILPAHLHQINLVDGIGFGQIDDSVLD